MIGDLGEARTPDPLIKSQLLYRLSYEITLKSDKKDGRFITFHKLLRNEKDVTKTEIGKIINRYPSIATLKPLMANTIRLKITGNVIIKGKLELVLSLIKSPAVSVVIIAIIAEIKIKLIELSKSIISLIKIIGKKLLTKKDVNLTKTVLEVPKLIILCSNTPFSLSS